MCVHGFCIFSLDTLAHEGKPERPRRTSPCFHKLLHEAAQLVSRLGPECLSFGLGLFCCLGPFLVPFGWPLLALGTSKEMRDDIHVMIRTSCFSGLFFFMFQGSFTKLQYFLFQGSCAQLHWKTLQEVCVCLLTRKLPNARGVQARPVFLFVDL